MSEIGTISQLLKLSQCQYRVYDIGRKLDKLSKDQFEKIEDNMQPYPFPMQEHAMFAVAFWQKNSLQPYLWFIKLPLDERGLLNQGARNHFLAIIIEALGTDLSVDPSEKQEELLNANPYHFTPAQYKLAALNSRLNNDLKQAASTYYEECQAYFSGQVDWQAWQTLGLQGIADFAERIEQGDNALQLSNALTYLPEPVIQPLCYALEHQTLPVSLLTSIISQYQKTQNCHYLRALAHNSTHPYVIDLIDEILSSKQITDDVLITVSGRCWQALADPERLLRYFEALVMTDNQPLFAAMFKDLVAIPLLRPIVFQCMRQPKRSEKLAKAIGQLFSQTC